MIVTTCFLQYIAAARKPPRQPHYSTSQTIGRNRIYASWLGIVVAAALHLAWFTLPTLGTIDQTITPPQPIMVNLISVPAASTPTAKALQKPEHKTLHANPEPLPKAAKPQPVMATRNETVSPMMAAPREEATTKTAAEPEANTAPPSTSHADVSNNTAAESDQAPLTLPHLNADYLNNPPPAYPESSRQRGEQGRVLLRVLVNAAGTVEQITLRKSSGYQQLDEAAQDSVKQWRFVPGQRGTQVVAAWVVVPISFSLEG